jgi:hypothetical protein
MFDLRQERKRHTPNTMEGPASVEGTSKSDFKHKHTVGQDVDGVEEALSQNRRVAGAFTINKCEKEAARNWDLFYKHHEGEL